MSTWLDHRGPDIWSNITLSVSEGALGFFLFVLFFQPCCTASRIFVPQPGIEPGPCEWKHQVLTTGPPGNSPVRVFWNEVNIWIRRPSKLPSCIGWACSNQLKAWIYWRGNASHLTIFELVHCFFFPPPSDWNWNIGSSLVLRLLSLGLDYIISSVSLQLVDSRPWDLSGSTIAWADSL